MSGNEEFIQEFLVECAENLDQLDQDFVAVEEDPATAIDWPVFFAPSTRSRVRVVFLDLPNSERSHTRVRICWADFAMDN